MCEWGDVDGFFPASREKGWPAGMNYEDHLPLKAEAKT